MNLDRMWRFLMLLFPAIWFMIPMTLAVGAYPYPQDVKQPDGSTLTIRLHGDEWYNWITTTDGYRILKSSRGYYEYGALLKSGELVASGVRASNIANRKPAELRFLAGTPKNLGISTDQMLKRRQEKSTTGLKSANMYTFFPSRGEANLLVILANFSDTQPLYGQQAFRRFMNEPGYDGRGSFRDYYLEVSGGLLTVNSTVTQWVQVPWAHDYYGPNDKWNEFAFEAIQAAAAAGVDFSLFDNDGDGIVEGVAIIHQGAGQEVTGDERDIWSHSHTFSADGIPSIARTFNGVVVNQYTVQPEWRTLNGEMNSIGVICHEFGHNLGLHDFYDTSGGIRDGTGKWDIMAAGAYNGNPAGSSPAHHNPFSKKEMDWVQQVVIDEPQQIQIEPVITSRQTLRVNASNENDYLLLENRRRTGFDRYIPGEGMLVYHADSTLIAERRYSNIINAFPTQGFCPISAGEVVNDASCPFPGTLTVSELTDFSTPAALTNGGEPFRHSLTNIKIEGENVTFDFMAIQDGAPLIISAHALNSESIEVSWTPSETGYPILLAWSSDGVFGLPENGRLYQSGDEISGGGTVLYYGSAINAVIHGSLPPSAEYHYSVWSNKGASYSQNLTISGRTNPAPVVEFPWMEGFEDGLNGWRQDAVSGNNEWKISSRGTQGLPEAAFEGENFAYLRITNWSTPVTRLITPVLNLKGGKNYFLDFRHVQPVWELDQDVLSLWARTLGGEWEEVTLFDENTTGWAHRRVKLPYDEPLELAFQGASNYGYGIAIDAVRVYEESVCVNPPVGKSYGVAATDITELSMSISWSRGDGDATLVVARKDKPVYELPVNGVSYNAGAVFGAGDDIGNNSYVVYNGSGNSFDMSGLDHTSDYHFAFFEYYSGSFCYQYVPAVDTFSTRPRKYDIVLEVKDFEGMPIGDALVTVENTEVYTSPAGLAPFSLEYSELFTAYHITKLGYSPLSGRFTPDGNKQIAVTLNLFEAIPPSGLKAVKDYQTIDLTWNPVINDNFESYPSFTKSPAGWNLQDNDASVTYGFSQQSFPGEGEPMAFIVFNVYDDEVLQLGYNSSARSGAKVLACFASVNGPNDDWIISPVFEVQEGNYFSFAARSLTANFGLEVFNVKIKPEGEDTWQTLHELAMAPEIWTLFEYDLSGYLGQRVEVAIQCVSDDAFALFLDDLRIGPQPGSLPALPAPFNAVENKIERVKPEGFPKRAIKAPHETEEASPPGFSRNVRYQLFKNQALVTTLDGFEEVHFQDDAVGCTRLQYSLRAHYPGVDVYSGYTTAPALTSCYSVLFKVVGSDNAPVKDAGITFNGETLRTDAYGEVLFEGVGLGVGKSYSILKAGFDTLEDEIDVADDMIVEVVLQKTASGVTTTWMEDISLIPNPVKSTALLKGLPSANCPIEVYDVTGKKVKSLNSKGKETVAINMSSYPTGIYIIIVTHGQQVVRMKIVKSTQ